MRFVVSLLLFLAMHASAAELVGRVVGVADGDTLTILDADRVQHVIRLAGIDAPEKGQAFGNVSKRHLSDLAYGREAVAECGKVDRYGRSVCRVLVGAVDVCLEQVRAGLAWHYRAYASEQAEPDRVQYAQAEQAARADGVGLWREAAPLAPWEWRRAAR